MFLKKLIADLMLLADSRPTIVDKLYYFGNLIIVSAPVVYLMDSFGIWFATNQRFCSFVIIAVVLNMIVGAWYHYIMKTFSWESLIKRNSVMMVAIIVAYILLEQLRITAGNNVAGDVFGVVIQLATLIYPTSKVLKNVYILSNKQFPPRFIMDKLYKFEQTGNVKDLFDAGQHQQDYNQYNEPNENL